MTDLEALEYLERVCFPDPWSQRVLSEALHHENYQILIQRDPEGTPLGYLIGWRVGAEAELARIGVVTEARRKGHSRILLDKALEKWQEQGVCRVFLEVREGNAPARSLYESRGFQPIGKRTKYYADGTDALVLSLDLG